MKPCLDSNCRQEGFTLLEVMMAMSLLAVVSLSAALLLLPILDEQHHTREVTRATGHTRAVLEDSARWCATLIWRWTGALWR